MLDENIDLRIAVWLRSQEHDVTVARDYARPLSDPQVLEIAHREQRALLTNDRDFGELVVRNKLPHAGIIYLRLGAASLEAQIDRLQAVLTDHWMDLNQLLVVTPRTVRVRRV